MSSSGQTVEIDLSSSDNIDPSSSDNTVEAGIELEIHNVMTFATKFENVNQDIPTTKKQRAEVAYLSASGKTSGSLGTVGARFNAETKEVEIHASSKKGCGNVYSESCVLKILEFLNKIHGVVKGP